jgi:hypothetical protein
MTDEFVPDRWKGISLGLGYKFRLLQIKEPKGYLIFDYTTGKIVEHIPPKETEFFTEQFAMKRLYEINELNKNPSREVLEAIDQTA